MYPKKNESWEILNVFGNQLQLIFEFSLLVFEGDLSFLNFLLYKLKTTSWELKNLLKLVAINV